MHPNCTGPAKGPVFKYHSILYLLPRTTPVMARVSKSMWMIGWLKFRPEDGPTGW